MAGTENPFRPFFCVRRAAPVAPAGHAVASTMPARRRRIARPSPAKPSAIIAQLDGSGTAEANRSLGALPPPRRKPRRRTRSDSGTHRRRTARRRRGSRRTRSAHPHRMRSERISRHVQQRHAFRPDAQRGARRLDPRLDGENLGIAHGHIPSPNQPLPWTMSPDRILHAAALPKSTHAVHFSG